MTDAIRLELMEFPLTDLQLIEASAGTGKTFTIAILYLRLLLGLSDVQGRPGLPDEHDQQATQLPPGLLPQEILVVTFTEAATEELRDRIRLRIGEMRRVCLAGESDDSILQQLLNAYLELRADSGLSEAEILQQAARTLEDAARSMDEAAIFTIHGFCQRMLRQHAFESGSLFESELITDDTPWLRLALLDFWRNHLYAMPEAVSQQVLQLWKTPDELLAEIRPWLHTHGLQMTPALPEMDLEAAMESYSTTLEQIRQAWLSCDEDIEALIASSGVNKNSYRKTSVPKWLQEIGGWLKRGGAPGKKLIEILEKFRQSTLMEKSKKNPPQLALFAQLDSLLDQLADNEVPLREYLLQKAWREVGQSLAQHKAERRLLAFDDLLSGLANALRQDDQQQLAEAIRQQFPVALIDEFQDTDPQQFYIFNRLYAGQPGRGLIMIGDPKQAIYAFRGGDIFTYISARRSVAQPRTLDTNWRSTTAMISAVNAVFAGCENPFIYDEDIPFQPVQAGGKADSIPLTLGGQPLPALQVWQDDELHGRGSYRSRFAEATALEIERLLAGAQLGERALEAGEIAILVRDRNEARAVRDALGQRRIASVYLSNRDSVFNSQEALDLYRILLAVQEPTDERALRAALACRLLGMNVTELNLLNENENNWEAAVEEFSGYRDCWQRLGVLPMLHRLLHYRQLAVKLLQQMGGERRLTDLLHLGELLQQASTGIEGMAGLLRWFTDQVMSDDGAGDDQLLRLESDANLVTVVTIHKSKGLEYPVVFLPFVSDFREAKTGFYHDSETQAPVWALDNNEDAVAAADGERLAEELRLLYVGLTRAVYRCYIGATEIKVGNYRKSQLARSALGHLLGVASQLLPQALDKLAASEGVAVSPLPESGADGQLDLLGMAEEEAPQLNAEQFTGRINRDWRLSSYSALAYHSSHGGGPALPQPGVDLEVMDEVAPVPAPEQPEHTIFSFPRGARAGTFLHSLFEEIPFMAPDTPEAQETKRQLLIRNGYGVEVPEEAATAMAEEEAQPWLAVIDQLMVDVLEADLQGMQLAQLQAADMLVEMEFMLPVSRLNAPRLNTLIEAHDPLSAQATSPLQFDQLRGMLKGFIDLVFRVDGRYYIADYKSNHLGDSLADYHPQALDEAMLSHRYDLQYQLYSLALHRLLQQRLPDYDPSHHLGGVFYLFLRGMKAGEQNGVFYRPANVALVQALDALFKGDEQLKGESPSLGQGAITEETGQ
ncbi:MAG: exodeoxyribonuclease V subunit beta [Marinobacterium sp.]|nr:exodeoxyribonuclease V subunit beta [Marinobacterium sp.]